MTKIWRGVHDDREVFGFPNSLNNGIYGTFCQNVNELILNVLTEIADT